MRFMAILFLKIDIKILNQIVGITVNFLDLL